MIRRTSAAALLAVVALAGCSGGSGDDDGSSSPSPTSTASSTVPAPAPTTDQPTSAPPSPETPEPVSTGAIGPDLRCMDPSRCYFQNPKQLNDQQLEAYLESVPGADKDPDPGKRPWPFIVIGIGDGTFAGSSEPGPNGAPVTDQYGIVAGRAIFTYCRVAEGGGAVTATTPRDKIWYQVEQLFPNSPAKTWVNGKHLYPYQHNGMVPGC